MRFALGRRRRPAPVLRALPRSTRSIGRSRARAAVAAHPPPARAVRGARVGDLRAAHRVRARGRDPARIVALLRAALRADRPARRPDAGAVAGARAGAAAVLRPDAPGARSALVRAAREVARGRVDLRAADHERGWRAAAGDPRASARWTVECLALHGQGRYDQLPAGDLAYRKLVGRLRAGGDPRARAEEDEVREFFAPYGEWAGWRARTRSPARRGARGRSRAYAGSRVASCLPVRNASRSVGGPSSCSSPRRAGTRSSATSAAALEQLVVEHPAPVAAPTRRRPASRTAWSCRWGRTPAAWRGPGRASWPRSRSRVGARRRASTPACGSLRSASWPRASALQERAAGTAPRCARVLLAHDERRARCRSARRPARPRMITGLRFSRCELHALDVPEGAERRVDPLGQHRRHEVEADVDLLDRARGPRRPRRGSSSGTPTGRGCPRCRRSCPARSLGVGRPSRLPSDMIDVSGRCTSAPIETSFRPLSRASSSSGS